MSALTFYSPKAQTVHNVAKLSLGLSMITAGALITTSCKHLVWLYPLHLLFSAVSLACMAVVLAVTLVASLVLAIRSVFSQNAIEKALWIQDSVQLAKGAGMIVGILLIHTINLLGIFSLFVAKAPAIIKAAQAKSPPAAIVLNAQGANVPLKEDA